jgi:epoxide hydrolase-like predicted phosphatase
MSDITTIFFDWGGVIADDPGDDFLKLLLKDGGASEAQTEEIYETYMRRFMRGEITEKEYWDELRAKYGLKIHDSISEEFKKWNGLVKNEEVWSLISEAKAHGLQVAILSNVIEPTYNALAQTGYYDDFDEVIASCKVGFAKPQREIYELALAQLKTTALQSVFIDDKQRNLDPAEAMGFRTILAQNPAQIISDIRQVFSEIDNLTQVG